MPMKIVILEDDNRRVEAMRDRLVDRFYQFEHVFFDSATDLKRYLEDHLNEVIVFSLDHDLELKVDAFGKTHDPGTGREIAEYLARHEAVCPVIIHSTNYLGSIGMETVLKEAGWRTCRVTPFDDLNWIHDAWFPAIRRAIVRPYSHPEP